MKMFYGNAPIKSMNVKHYELNTNDATLKASDMQAGITAYAKGKKVIGTGKSFEFANYGALRTNLSTYVPTNINVLEVSSTQYPIKLNIELNQMKDIDFSSEQIIGSVLIDGVEHNLIANVASNILNITCDETFYLQVFYGKDNYV